MSIAPVESISAPIKPPASATPVESQAERDADRRTQTAVQPVGKAATLTGVGRIVDIMA